MACCRWWLACRERSRRPAAIPAISTRQFCRKLALCPEFNRSVASTICRSRATNGVSGFTSRAGRLSVPGKDLVATYRAVFPGYFRTMRIPILRGRDVTDADNLRAPGVVVINDYLARRYWPGEDAIGKRITFDDPAKNPSWLTVVGVAKNTARGSWVSPPEEEVFLPYLQNRDYLDASNAAICLLDPGGANGPRPRGPGASHSRSNSLARQRTFRSPRFRPWTTWSLKPPASRAFT